MPVEGFAPAVVGCDVDMKDETMFPQVVISFLGDVRTEVRVPAIRSFDGIPSQSAGDQRVGVRKAISNQMHCLAGVAGTFGRFFRNVGRGSLSRRWY